MRAQACLLFSAEGSAVSKPGLCYYLGVMRGQIGRPLLLKRQLVTQGSREGRAPYPQGVRETRVRTFIVVFNGRKQQGRVRKVSQFRIGYYE